MNFHIEDESYKEDSVVIRLQGEVDLYAAPELKDHVNRAIESGKTKLILDLQRGHASSTRRRSASS